MAGEWDVVPLEQVYEFTSGLSKPRSEFGSGYPFLSFKDVFYNTFIPKELNELVNSTEQERSSCSVKRGDVFLTRTSETLEDLGMSCVALSDIPGATFNGFTKRLRPKSNQIIVPEYAGYFFRSPTFRRAVTAMSSLSTRASLNHEMLARLTITIPPAREQAAIGGILKLLDEKIELNRRMNETLEAMVSALFKSWFVDFEPVRAKAENRDPGLPKPLADLFPGRLIDSELGEIPEGWDEGSFGSLISQRSERVGSREVVVLSAVASGRLAKSDDHFTKRVYSKETDKYLVVEQWDFAYNPSRINIGSIGMLEEEILGGVSPVYVVVRPKPVYRWFLKFSIQRAHTKAWINTLASGSVRQSLSYTDFASIPCVVPPEAVAQEFDRRWSTLREGIRSREAESHTLSTLRDTLLPKLISGELRVKDPGKFIKEAV